MTGTTNATTPEAKPEHQLPQGWIVGADGKAVHIDNMDPLDKARDKLVKRLSKKANNMRAGMEIFRGEIDSDIDLHLEALFHQSGKESDGKLRGLTLLSYDGLLKVQRTVSGTLKFDERILVAQKLVDDVIKNQRGSKILKTLAQGAFDMNSEGDYNPAKLSALTKHKFDNEDWIKACNLIHQSRYYVGKKPYVRFYQRESVNDKFEPVALDMAKV